MDKTKIVRVAEWDGWCASCATERPLVLTRTGRLGLRSWLAGAVDPGQTLTLTCRLCGIRVPVPAEQDDPPVVLDEEHEFAAGVPVPSEYSAVAPPAVPFMPAEAPVLAAAASAYALAAAAAQAATVASGSSPAPAPGPAFDPAPASTSAPAPTPTPALPSFPTPAPELAPAAPAPFTFAPALTPEPAPTAPAPFTMAPAPTPEVAPAPAPAFVAPAAPLALAPEFPPPPAPGGLLARHAARLLSESAVPVGLQPEAAAPVTPVDPALPTQRVPMDEPDGIAALQLLAEGLDLISTEQV